MDDESSDAIVRHAFCEQRQLNLNWYNSITSVKNRLEVEESKPLIWPNQIRTGLKNWFKRTWNIERSSNKKLKFYNSIKPEFKEELYLRLDLNSTVSKRIAQLRSSSHNLNIETGRYGANRLKLANRACKHCCTDDEGTLDLLLELPFPTPIIEDEEHVLRDCPLYDDLRVQLCPFTQNLLGEDITLIFENSIAIRDFGSYVRKIFDRRDSFIGK